MTLVKGLEVITIGVIKDQLLLKQVKNISNNKYLYRKVN